MAGAEDSKTGKKGPPPLPATAAARTVPSGSAGTMVLESADELAATQAAVSIANASGSLVGTTLANRYQVRKRLGEGGMGTVYEALHTVLEKPVALKVLHPEMARKSDLVDRFLQEAKAASRIRHENVIDISDFGAADGQVYFAMELLHGHDLHEEITRARKQGKLLPWARTKNIFLQICSALSVAHERGIVHRDLKPENIYLVEFRGDPDFVKLLDFGIAKLTDVSSSEEGRKLTRTGMLFGTPEYMAPEQARGERADHRVDIYAMGCILFLLVSNRLPFQAENFMGVLSQHLTDDPPEIAPETFDHIGAPREIADVIDRALEKDREYRWQTIDELAAAICEACGDPAPKARSRPPRAPSVDAPEETTRSRTPTGDPTRARTPSGSQRFRSPTGPQRPRTPTGPRSKPPTSPPRTPELSWVGDVASVEARASVISLGAVPEPEQKGFVFSIVAGLLVLAMIGGAAYALGWFGGDSSQPSDTAAPIATAGSSAPAVAPAPQNVAAPTEELPEISEVVIQSVPAGATLIALPDNTTVGKTPHTLTLLGSSITRRYKLVLAGHDDVTVDVLPNKAKITLAPRLVRTTAVAAPEPRPTAAKPDAPSPNAPPPAVNAPDTSTAITSPGQTAPPAPETKPAEAEPAEPDEATDDLDE